VEVEEWEAERGGGLELEVDGGDALDSWLLSNEIWGEEGGELLRIGPHRKRSHRGEIFEPSNHRSATICQDPNWI
jgi:hypothetical protein